MPANSRKFPLVRCPKCGRLLPELPPNSVYRCGGGCDGFLRAHKNSPLSDDLSENSSEKRPSEDSMREGNHGGFIGIDRDSDRISPNRVTKSPARFTFGDPTRKSPVRETNSDGLDGQINSPILSEASGRSVDGDDRKSPLREIGYGHGKSLGGQVGRRDDHSGKFYGRRRVEIPYDDRDDDGDHGVLRRRNRHLRAQDGHFGVIEKPRERMDSFDRSSNYRTELLREYNYLHEKLIRVGDLISNGQSGKGDQGYSSTDCSSGPDDYVYDELSGHRIGTVRSPGLKGITRMRPHSTYDIRRKYLHQRSSFDSQSDGSSSANDQKTRVLLVNQNGQLCHPIDGGAPFVICYNCFQLLKLPGKLITAKKSQFRLQCGSCCKILSLDLNMRRSDASKCLPSKTDSAEVAGEEEKPSVNGLLPLPPPPGSPLRDRTDYVYANKRSDETESDTSNQDKGSAGRESSIKTCAGKAAVSTELELDSSEIPKTGSSQGSAETSIRKYEGGSSEASEIQDSSLPNLSTSLANADVFVNGKLITPNAVRKAEKMAGPISPGDYWYDSRAGFWGLMGYVCLGIIPPFIEEFSSQMLENCSGGDTCIYVNGRELHQNDLNLLSSRGLPRTRYKYYVVDISGKVQDEDSGGFVVNLGKLAPTVVSTGCGFGMRSPGAHKY